MQYKCKLQYNISRKIPPDWFCAFRGFCVIHSLQPAVGYTCEDSVSSFTPAHVRKNSDAKIDLKTLVTMKHYNDLAMCFTSNTILQRLGNVLDKQYYKEKWTYERKCNGQFPFVMSFIGPYRGYASSYLIFEFAKHGTLNEFDNSKATAERGFWPAIAMFVTGQTSYV